MKKVLFLSNNPMKYKSVLDTLLKENIYFNIISSYNTNALDEIIEMNPDTVIVEDDGNNSLAFNSAKYLTRFLEQSSIIFISDNITPEITKEIPFAVDFKYFINNYMEILSKYDIELIKESKTTVINSKKYLGNIIVIDDDEIYLDIVENILQEEGYRVYKFTNPKHGISFLKTSIQNEYKVSLIILDLLMPVVNGFDILENIRSLKPLKETPIIVVSAMRDSESVEKVSKYNVKGYVAKPFDKKLLLDRINLILGQQK